MPFWAKYAQNTIPIKKHAIPSENKIRIDLLSFPPRSVIFMLPNRNYCGSGHTSKTATAQTSAKRHASASQRGQA
jgi:hypothetical protein